MSASPDTELIQLLNEENKELRMLALHWLGEGYAAEPAVLEAVFSGWDRYGIAAAFPEFPMLSHIPAGAEQVEECCARAAAMVRGNALTSPDTRSAGKLIEQVALLPAAVLQPHLELLERTVSESKIFFRVDLPGLRHRIELLDSSADQLAGQLDESIERLARDPEDPMAPRRALHALEALRREHPNYMDLSGVLIHTPPSAGPHAANFQITLQSLTHFAEPGLEGDLGRHLNDQRETVFVPVVDALVRSRSKAAAECLLEAYPPAEEANRQWIARGLQRLRVKGFASRLAELRAATEDPRLWLMLLVAEIRQTDISHCARLAADVGRVTGYAYALFNALLIFNRVTPQTEETQPVRTALIQYLARTRQDLHQPPESKPEALQAAERRALEQARREVINRYRKDH